MTSEAVTNPAPDEHAPWGTHEPGIFVGSLLSLTRHTPLGRGRMRSFLHGLMMRSHSGPLDCRLYGQPMRAYLAGNRCEWKAVLNPAQFDPHERRLIATALDRPDAVMLDIGANVGIHALAAAGFARPDARIIAFEPHPDTFRRLKFNLGLGAFKGFTAIEAALGDSDGYETMSGNDLSLSTLAIVGEGPRVRVRTLLDCLAELAIDHIDILKIDVEGYEEAVLKPFFAGASDNLMPRLVIIEELAHHVWDFNCVDAFVQSGLKIIGRAGNNVILAKPDMQFQNI